jgi:intermediate cleaving peptidase 55
VENATTIYVDASNQNASAHNALSTMLDGKVKQPLRQTMHQLRVQKSDAEATVMRHAGKASGRAFNRAIAQHFSYEKDLCAFLEYEFKRRGCDGSAYVPVVAGGKVCP